MPVTSSPDLLAGRYRLEARLGRGGMGEVWAGTDVRLDRGVAVKLLRPELSDQADLRTRFEREARAAARISHPNVVAVFDTGEHHGVPFIVMERLPGSTLADELTAGELTQARACAVVLETLSALEAAHRLGVLHRDIKPANILRGHDGHAKVADFGIATIAEDSNPATTGILLGTAAYVAPERLSGAPAAPASDLYSVGVVLYEALAGRPPFRADTPLGLVHAICEGRPSPLIDARPDVAPEVIAVVDRAMATDPDRRFDSAAAMAGALAPAGHRPPVAESTPTVPIATAPAARTDRVPRSVPPTELLDPTRPPAEPAPPHRSPRRPSWRWLLGTAAFLLAVVVLVFVLTSGGGGSAPPTTTPTSQTSGANPASGAPTVPAPLQRAIDRLDRSVRP